VAEGIALPPDAGVVKLVDALDSKSSSERSVGSIPTTRTIFRMMKTSSIPNFLGLAS
jgi:hypothetical protein